MRIAFWLVLLAVGCSSDVGVPEAPTCGDGSRLGDEQCDGRDLDGETCASAGFDGGVLRCRDDCTFDTTACLGTGPVCGDGVAEGLEECDGDDPPGTSCASLGFDGGVLDCTSCAWNTNGCIGDGPSCGDGVAEGLEECDGADLRQQSCIGLGYAGGTLACKTDCSYDRTVCVPANPYVGDQLDTALGCEGVYNPDQLLDFHLTMAPGDWATVLADTSYTQYVPADFVCGSAAPILVAVRRKRSGGTNKVGLKIDINQLVSGQTFYGLKKLSLENGSSSGTPSDGSLGDLVAEYLAWRVMQRSGTMASRVAFVRLFVNGDYAGAFVDVEQVDKVFLDGRLGDDTGWLYKKSGGDGDGLKTHESDGLADANPYDDYFCFWEKNSQCAMPADVATTLPDHLQIGQMLRFGAVNALISNNDSPLLKDNNYYYYDWAGGRVYLPWDLDTVMQRNYDVFTGTVSGGTTMYTDALFPAWEAEYDQILTEMLATTVTPAGIDSELDRVLSVAGAALDADPWAEGAPVADDVEALSAWWVGRHAEVQAQVDAH